MTDEPGVRERAQTDGGAPLAPAEPLHGVRSVLIAAIFTLLVFYTFYFTAEILVPIVFALLLKLLLQPGYRALTRVHVPAPIAALAMIALLFGLVVAFGYGLAGAATSWVGRLPQSLPRIEQHLSSLRGPMDQLLGLAHKLDSFTAGGGAPSLGVGGSSLTSYLFSGTRSLLTGLGITVLMLFFLLASGDLFMRRLVEVLPRFQDKKQAVEISHEIEHNISAYLVTITFMNLLVGIATGLAMWAIGLPDPTLWGAMAFIFNYVMILGPLTGIIVVFLVGLLTFPSLFHALLPPAAYLAIHIIEGEAVTPYLVARRFTLNPVLVIGSLIFWDWMWGIPGALLAVPLLAIFKIVCDRVGPLMAIGHFIEG